jgi:cell shape-determining protein MreC
VRQGNAVVSNHFAIGQGEAAGLRGGMAILLGEVFLGWVEKIGPHVSRVKLLCDPSVQMKVRIGRFAGDRFVLAEGYFWLVGRGEGAMEIRDVEARMAQAAAVEVGDVVLSDAANDALPAAMTIGRVSAVLPDRDNPLFVHLEVRPMLDAARMERVFVYDPQSEGDEEP